MFDLSKYPHVAQCLKPGYECPETQVAATQAAAAAAEFTVLMNSYLTDGVSAVDGGGGVVTVTFLPAVAS